ncbi:MAG: hypothetical protein WCP15_01500 [bacterium]
MRKNIIIGVSIVIIVGLAVFAYIKFSTKSLMEDEFTVCISVGETAGPISGPNGLIYIPTPFSTDANSNILKSVIGEDILIGKPDNSSHYGIWAKGNKGFNRSIGFSITSIVKELTADGGILSHLNMFESVGVSFSKPQFTKDAYNNINLFDFESVKKSSMVCK